MTKLKAKKRTRLKSFRVGYFLEQGFAINVRAKSTADAERIVENLLAQDHDELPGSERVHCDYGVVDVEAVRS